MANIKSQKKRVLTNEKRRVRNKAYRTALKSYVKRFNAAIESGDLDRAATELQVASRQLDRAVSKGVLHKNNAANKKSSLARRLHSARS